MGNARRQWTGRFTDTKVGDVTAGAGAGDEVNSASFDTRLGGSPSFKADIVDLAQNKKLKMKMQESNDSAANFVDVPVGQKTNLNPDTEISANGLQRPFYAGNKRYVRLVITSVDAAPGATIRVYGRLDNIDHVPGNVGI